jgi:CBS domain-containing protein
MIESGVRRIGAEQELFLADGNWRPAAAALKVLERLDDPQFTTELGLFNLELNLEPGLFDSSCLSDMEAQLNAKLRRLQEACDDCGVHPVLTGILPTIRLSDLGLENMTPMPRYHALNRAMNEMRGGAYEFHIKGLDELLIKHDSVMVESCNASFQVHFQVGHEESANLYNVAQVVAAPVLAAASNSPMLFGRQLWRETRIALFQQAVDTRSAIHHLRDRSPRVTFGSDWVRRSVTEIFQEDIARFRTLVARDVGEDSLATLRAGGVPSLEALRLHNGTVYRWNRACYGITDGKPHLRIENRVLPSGPTVLDEVANAAFWFGLMIALSHKYGDIRQMLDFEDAKMNFTSAARLGLGAQMTWFQGETVSATSLICDRLLPMAEEALLQRGVDEKDVRKYLKVIDQRVNSHRTGSQWLLHSMSVMRGQGTASEQLNALVAGMVRRQFDGSPVHEWKPARLKEAGGWKHNFLKVEQYMTTDLYTVQQDEPVQLVATLMEWNRIRHVPVEDKEHNLVGLISYRQLLKYLARGAEKDQSEGASAADIMVPGPHTIDPGASTLEAIALMRQHRIGCLPVVKEGRLVGVITEHDFMNVSAELLEQKLKE